MDHFEYKRYEPLFGGWVLAGELGQTGSTKLFALERQGSGTVQHAVLKVIFIPCLRDDIHHLMQQMHQVMDPAAFAQQIAEAARREISIQQRLKGKPFIHACEEYRIAEREDKSGIDILMRFARLLPLEVYLQQHGLAEADLLQLGIAAAGALESCRQAGVVHGGIGPAAFFVTPQRGFRLGRFAAASLAADTGAVPQAEGAPTGTVQDLRALGEMLDGLAADVGAPVTPAFRAVIRKLRGAGSTGGCSDPLAARRELERLASEPESDRTGARGEALPAAETVRQADRPGKTERAEYDGQGPAAAAPAPTGGPVYTAGQTYASPENMSLAELFDGQTDGGTAAKGMPPSAAKRRRKWLAAGAAAVVCLGLIGFGAVRFGLPAVRAFVAGQNGAGDAAGPSASPAAVQGGQDDGASEPTPEPALSPEEMEQAAREERIRQVLAPMEELCTGTPPAVKDPGEWNAAGKALMDRLEADPYYQEWGFTASVSAFAAGGDGQDRRRDITAAIEQWQQGVELPEQYPYLIAVNRAASTVTVYSPDDEGRYTVPYMAMVCSGGPDTPTGFWFTPISYQWRTLVGPCYGQNATRIWDSYLFHSVPYYTQHKDDVEYDQYNQLGTQASLGCIRLAVVDVKWIFDNCPIGTPVVIYDDGNDPGPMGKPGTIYTDPADLDLRGWDPTDPDPANPWADEYRAGTAIRSQAAWEEFSAAMADGRWDGTINVTDLQGWSTDSAVEGTRG